MKIAVDGMGGDNAPQAIVEGAVQAAREFGLEIILVGIPGLLEAELSKHKPKQENISIYQASQVIGMNESPASSVRKKRNSSIAVAFDLVKENLADAVITAGNTGAAVCAATLALGMIEGLERPGIAILIPTLKATSLLIDVGANIDPKPTHLLHYGIMGNAYCQHTLNRSKPVIGLLNIGEEESKGTEFIKETRQLFEQSKLNFAGNVEGREIFSGKYDCIVCDGFVGNVALKVSEGLAEAMGEFLRRRLTKSPLLRFGTYLIKTELSSFKKEIDYSEYGGALLLGIDGISIICHGRSSGKAIKNAIRVAKEAITHKVNHYIAQAIKTGST